MMKYRWKLAVGVFSTNVSQTISVVFEMVVFQLFLKWF